MVKHLYKTPIPSICKGTVDRQVKSNPRNNLIYGRHRCGTGRNSRGIIAAKHRGGGHKPDQLSSSFECSNFVDFHFSKNEGQGD
jgi:hypothetical protein